MSVSLNNTLATTSLRSSRTAVTSIAAAVRRATTELAKVSPSPRRDAELLVMHVLGLTLAELITRATSPLSKRQRRRFARLIHRRRRGEPLAYLTGTREFWSLPLRVTPATLIPRPETETLVERALACIPADGAGWTIADIGTGCGAIALALASARARARVIATDQSSAALAVARKNAACLGLTHVEFRCGHWLAPLTGERVQLLVSNPPYVRSADPHLTVADLRFEPASALDGGRDGLAALHHIIRSARTHLHPGSWLMLEHGWDQREAVARVMQQQGYTAVGCYADLAGFDRVSVCRCA